MLMGIGGVVFGALGLGGYMMFFKGSAHQPPPQEKTATPVAAGEEKRAKAQVITLKPIVVNLRNSKGTRYLKVTVAMETTSKEAAEELGTLSPQISDLFVDKLSNVEITDVDNSAGRNRLKRELLSGINELLEKGSINTIYFTEFVIQ